MITLQAGDFDSFFNTPFQIYDDDAYVSPMKADLQRLLSATENPAFANPDDLIFYTAFRAGSPVGRITAHIQREYNTRYGTRDAFFGFFDCINEKAVAETLLQAAEQWAQEHGCLRLIGNVNLVPTQQMGVQTDHFEATPYTDQQCNPKHIPELLTACGYEAFFPMSTWQIDLSGLDAASLLGTKHHQLLESPRTSFASLSRAAIGTRLEEARQLLNTAFNANPMFVPVSKEAFEYQSKELRWIMDRRISAVLHHEGKPAGTVICIPDLNGFLRGTRSQLSWRTPLQFLRYRFSRKRAILIFYAVAPEMQGKGVNTVLLHRVILEMQCAGYTTLGVTWIGEQNTASLGQIDKLGGTPLHKLHLFRRTLEFAE